VPVRACRRPGRQHHAAAPRPTSPRPDAVPVARPEYRRLAAGAARNLAGLIRCCPPGRASEGVAHPGYQQPPIWPE